MVGRITGDKSFRSSRNSWTTAVKSSPSAARHSAATCSACRISNALVERTPTGGERVLNAENSTYPAGPARRGRLHGERGVGRPGTRDVFFRQQPGVPSQSRRDIQGQMRVIGGSFRGAAAQRWRGGELPRRRCGMAEASLGRGKLYLFGPELLLPRPAAWHVQVLLQLTA